MRSISLIDQAVERLAHVRGGSAVAGRVHVDHAERTVFEVTMGGRSAFVKADTVRHRHERELLALQTARAGGVPVPDIVFSDDGPPALLVIAKAEGRPLDAQSPPAAWVDAGRQMRRLHDLPATLPPFGASGDWRGYVRARIDHEAVRAVENGLLAGPLAGRLHATARDLIAAMAEPSGRVIHGDCQPDHFLTTNARVRAMIDFGDAGTGDPAWDLVVLTLRDPDRLPDVLRGYAPDEPSRPAWNRWRPRTGSCATSVPLAGSTSTATTRRPTSTRCVAWPKPAETFEKFDNLDISGALRGSHPACPERMFE